MLATADTEGIFEILANYLNFSIDFLRLRGMDGFRLKGAIDKDLVAYFVAGVTMAFLMATIKRMPSYDEMTSRLLAGKASLKTAPVSEEAAEDSSDKAQIAAFVLISVVGSCFFHGTLILYSRWIHTFPHGGIKDTLNGIFAFNAVYLPMDALLKKVQQLLKTLGKAGGVNAIFAAIFLFAISLVYFSFAGLSVWALAQVHGTTFWQMFWPAMIAGLLMFVIVLIPIIMWLKNRETPDDNGCPPPIQQSSSISTP
jgi:hypothetical protein